MGILVNQKVKIVATVSSTRNTTQLTNFLNNTVFPRFNTRVTNSFSPIFKTGTLVVSSTVSYIFPHPTITRQFQLYPKFYIMGELLDNLTLDDFYNRWDTFIQDCNTQFMDGMTSFGGITLIGNLSFDLSQAVRP